MNVKYFAELISSSDLVLIKNVETKDIKVDVYEVKNEPDNDLIRLSWEYEGFCFFLTEESIEKAKMVSQNEVEIIALNNQNKEKKITISLFSIIPKNLIDVDISDKTD